MFRIPAFTNGGAQAPLPVVMRVLREYGPIHWRGYAMALALGLVSAACASATAFLLGTGVNQISASRDTDTVLIFCGAIVAIFALRGTSIYGQSVLNARISNRINADGQKKIFDRLLSQSLAYTGASHSSSFVSRVIVSAQAPGTILNMVVNSLCRDLITVVGLVAVMISQAPLLSVLNLLIFPPALLCLRRLARRSRAAIDRHHASSIATTQTVQETLQGMTVVKAFNMEETMRARMAEAADASRVAADRMTDLNNRLGPMMDTLGGLVVATIFAYGAYRVVATGASPGEFVAFSAAFVLAYEPAKRLARFNLAISKAVHDATLLFDILDRPAAETDEPAAPSLRVEAGGVTFDRVAFAYPGRGDVLRGLTFQAPAGKVTAFVGPSGGGKTTIFNLILRLHDVDAGEVRIDGQDISTVSRSSLRSQVGYVGQDVFLFSGSIRDNIAVARPDAADEDIAQAAKAAFAHDFIVGLPQGYATPVGELGSKLSTGQRQRIAIARALLKDVRLILLDEPTSSLDSRSEREVNAAIARLSSGRTTLVIAHRLNTVVNADLIHFIEDGSVREAGSHESLLSRNGLYAALFRSQFGHGLGGTADEQRAISESL